MAEDLTPSDRPSPDDDPTLDSAGGEAPTLEPGFAPVTEGPGSSIGPYRILETIGEGGFGTVFLAEQRTPVRRQVALKIIKLGMDTGQVVARFEQERQALAILDHPNIAKVLDAGATETGRPYFVMERCAGEPIDAFCDRHRLSIPDRLALFGQVCAAIQHAHTKGIIHRDVKPSNILVSAAGDTPLVKVIDFGIAKATSSRLTERTLFTEHRQLIGTPEYMSPEQAEGSPDIDTRTDVYALGVLLYEMLTGAPPIDARTLRQAAFEEIQRIIREVDPPRPSTRLSGDAASLTEVAGRRGTEPRRLGLLIRGDLDWIVMKALEKDRSRRYDSVAGFAADVRRFLAGEAVEAAPPSTSYRLRKLVRRHRVAVTAGAAVAAALLVGIAGFAWQADVARGERDEANAARLAEAAQRKLAEEQRERAEAQRARADEAAAEARRQQLAAERSSYSANLYGARAALELRDPEAVRQRLDACDPASRGWEWRRLHAEADESLATIASSDGRLLEARLLDDGRRMVIDDEGGPHRIVDVRTGDEPVRLEGDLRGLAVSPDGTRLAGGVDGGVRVLDISTGRDVHRLDAEGTVRFVAFSPDGDRLAAINAEGTLFLWDTGTRDRVATIAGNGRWFPVLAFSPDGTRLAVPAADYAVRIHDAATGAETAVMRGHAADVRNLRFVADGASVVSISNDFTARRWNALTGEQETVFEGHRNFLIGMAVDPSGRLLATTSADWTTRFWELDTGRQVGVAADYRGNPIHPAFSADGSRLAVGTATGSVWIHEVPSGQTAATMQGHADTVVGVAFAPDGERVITASYDGTVRSWLADPVPSTTGTATPGPGLDVTFGPEGERILVADEAARLYDARSLDEIAVFARPDDDVVAVAFHPRGHRIATGSRDGTIGVWNVDDAAERMRIAGHEGEIVALRFDAGGARIVSGSRDGTARLWDAESGAVLAALEGHDAPVRDVRFSPDGSRVGTASVDRTARIWDARTGETIAVLEGHDDGVFGLDFSPDGERIVTASIDGTARLWNARTFAEITTLGDGQDRYASARFSPDGTRIILAGASGTLRVCDGRHGDVLSVLRGHTAVAFGAEFSPDGSRIASVAMDWSLRVWSSSPHRDRLPPRIRSSPSGGAAAALVDELSARLVGWGAVADAIDRDGSLDDEVRAAAEVLVTLNAGRDRAAAAGDPPGDLTPVAVAPTTR